MKNRVAYKKKCVRSLESLVKMRQKKLDSRAGMSDDPLMHAIAIVEQHNNPIYSCIQNVLEIDEETFYDDEEQRAVERSCTIISG